MSDYVVYFRDIENHVVHTQEVEAENIALAIENTLKASFELFGLYPKDIDICHVEEVK